MVDPSDSSLSIRAALNRKALADARQRAALARRLGLRENEVLAVQHVARAGTLTPGQLGGQLQLSSGGVTALLHRLQRGAHITRDPHPRDGRSAVVRLTPGMQKAATTAWAPLVAEVEGLANDLSEAEREAVARFLERIAEPRSATPTASHETPSPRRGMSSPYPCRRSGRSYPDLLRGRPRAFA